MVIKKQFTQNVDNVKQKFIKSILNLHTVIPFKRASSPLTGQQPYTMTNRVNATQIKVRYSVGDRAQHLAQQNC